MNRGGGKGAKSVYSCSACGASFPKWSGQCPDCGAWNSLEEAVAVPEPAGGRFAGYAGDARQARVLALSEVESAEQAKRHQRQRRAGPGARRRTGQRLGGADRR